MQKTICLVIAGLALGLATAPARAQDKSTEDLLEEIRKRTERSRAELAARMAKLHEEDMADRRKTGRCGEWSSDRDGGRVAAVNGDNHVLLWLDDDAEADVVIEAKLPAVRATLLHPKQDVVYVVGDDDTIHSFSTGDGSLIEVLGDRKQKLETGGIEIETGGFSGATCSPSGRYMILLASGFGSDLIWDDEKGDFMDRALTGDLMAGAFRASFLADDRHVLVSTMGGLELHDVTVEAEEGEAPEPIWKLEGGRDRIGFGDPGKKKQKPLGEGFYRAIVLDSAGLAVTLQEPPIGKDESPQLAGWSLKTGKRKFRTAIGHENAYLMPLPDADVIYVALGRDRGEPYEIHLHSKRNGKRVRVLEFPVDGPQPRHVSADGQTAYDTDAEGNLVRFSVFPVPKAEDDTDGK